MSPPGGDIINDIVFSFWTGSVVQRTPSSPFKPQRIRN